jgi:D-aspartate ligase
VFDITSKEIMQDREHLSIAAPTFPLAIQRTGAVVIGGDFQGLGIARSLGRHGIPVCIIDDELSISRFSRYVTHSLRVKSLRDEQETVEHLLDAGQRLKLDGWVLYPTRDETVAALSRYRSRLTELYRVPTPSWRAIQWVWDKRNTYRLAQEIGIPVPRTWYPREVSELEPLASELPLAIKPAIKEHFIYATKAKAWRADTFAELQERFSQANALMEPGEAMIQEMIPGDGRQQFAYCAFFKEGRVIGSMVARRRRQHPPDFGRASTFVETVAQPFIEEYSERFLKAIDYYGLVELEYKLDPRDGQYKLLDVNARTWGYHSLGQRAGVDFPYMQFADQFGEPVEEKQARIGVSWVRLITDMPTSLVEIKRGNLSIGEYLRSLRNADIESVFCRDDPLPGLVELSLVPYLIAKRGF